MKYNEETLVKQLKNGEKKAMEAFYDSYAPVLFGITLRYTASQQDAEDVLHESLMKILSGIKTFSYTFPGSFEAWIRRVTVNYCLGLLRKRSNLMIVDKAIEAIGHEEETDDSDDSWRETSPEKIIAMIQQLPAGYRTVLNLFVFEQHTHKEIANMLNISENTSKSQLAKARMMLKKRLIHPETQKIKS